MVSRSDPGRPFTRDEVEAVYPLLPLQQGMLFHDLLSPEAQPYFRQASFQIHPAAGGGFDPDRCRAAWQALALRHDALRSVFDYQNAARPVRVVLRRGDVAFSQTTLVGLPPSVQAGRIAAECRRDRDRGFDLRHGPLTRIALFDLGDGRFEMVWSHPHILLDGWSGALLLAEFAEIYRALGAGRRPELPPPPPCQAYFDQIAARDHADAHRFWAGLLDGYDERAGLARPGPGRPGAAYLARAHVVALSPGRQAVLDRLAAAAGVTLNTVVRALWGILLGRHAGRDDVVFGAVVSGRALDVDGIERMVGAFINTIPVRVAVGADETLVSLLVRLQAQAIDALAHDHLSLADIQAASALPDGLFDHLLVFENYPEADHGDEAALGFRVVAASAEERANYDFGLIVQPGSPLRITFAYNGEVHTEAQMRRLGDQIETLIDSIAADPGRPVERLECLGGAEQAMLAAFARGAPRPPPSDETIVGLWRRQAARTPDRVALIADTERMSYRALDRRSERLAAALVRRPGFTAGGVVGVLAGRGIGRIVALLAILKAGAAYLPLSPALPDERLGVLIDDAAAAIVLTDAVGGGRLDAIRPGRGDGIDRLEAAGTDRMEPVAVGPDDLAYLLYTSGSTGQPKGVEVGHRGFVNMILGQIDGFGITADDCVLQAASCSFDASLSEIFMALLSGARLVLAGADVLSGRARLLETLRRHGVTVAGLSPSLLSALDFPDFPGLRVLISAGEAADPAAARQYAARLRFVNAYGPTEASVCASFHEVTADGACRGGVPIGRPLPNTGLHILDRFSRPVPIGAVGEICLSGPGLARGYRNRPDLTARAFEGEGAARLYRTGDLGLWRDDGAAVYRGRRDGQIKLNGRRIEPGEIEAALRTIPGLGQAAVTVAETGGPRRLVAYVTAAAPVDPRLAREHLARRLPSYMIPSAVVTVADLPRTLAGKLDRTRLPPPPAAAIAVAPPANDAERAVAAAFEAVLGGGGLGRDETFEALGGDSLAAIRVIGRLFKQGYVLDLRDLLTRQSIAAVAAVLIPRRAEAAAPAAALPGDAPLTPVQAAFFATHRRGLAHFNHAVLLQSAERIDDGALRAALAALWRHHDALRLRFPPAGTGIRPMAADPAAAPAPARLDLRGVADPWRAVTADAAGRHLGFDLATGPLVAATRYRLDEGDFVLLLAHHLVIDAVSWRFLLEDLSLGYRQARTGAPILLPPAGASYLEWARALEAFGRGEAIASGRAYWAAFAARPARPLPTDHPAVPHGYDETDLVTGEISALPASCSDAGLQDRLLSALSRAAAMVWDRPGAIRVELSHHGRIPLPGTGLDVGRTIGWFTADYPVLLDGAAAPRPSAADILAYGVLRAHDGAPDGGGAAGWTGIAFNYLGRTDFAADAAAGFMPVDRLDRASAGDLDRHVLLEIDAVRAGDRIDLAVRYCPRIHRAETIRRLVWAIIAAWDGAEEG